MTGYMLEYADRARYEVPRHSKPPITENPHPAIFPYAKPLPFVKCESTWGLSNRPTTHLAPQPGKLPGFRIDRSNIAALEPVADGTAERQILSHRFAAVLQRDHVIDLVLRQREPL